VGVKDVRNAVVQDHLQGTHKVSLRAIIDRPEPVGAMEVVRLGGAGSPHLKPRSIYTPQDEGHIVGLHRQFHILRFIMCRERYVLGTQRVEPKSVPLDNRGAFSPPSEYLKGIPVDNDGASLRAEGLI
jgi:hypothetical protein